MLCRTCLVTALFLVRASLASAQSPPDETATAPAVERTAIEATETVDVGNTEWMLTGGPAFSIVMFNSVRDHGYVLSTVSWSRILTRSHGPGLLRGRFAWAFAAVPLYGQFTPDDIYGFGITPMVARWNLEPRGRYAPLLEVGGGALWTQNAVPVRTSSANFTAHASAGVRIFIRQREAVLVGYRF